MATLAQIRQALRDVVRDVTGIDAAYRRVPEKPPADSVAEFGVIRVVGGDIAPSDKAVFDHDMELYVLTRRAGDIVGEDDRIDDYVDTMTDAFWAHMTLGGLTYGFAFNEPAWELVEVPYGDKSFYGIRFNLRLKTKKTITFEG